MMGTSDLYTWTCVVCVQVVEECCRQRLIKKVGKKQKHAYLGFACILLHPVSHRRKETKNEGKCSHTSFQKPS